MADDDDNGGADLCPECGHEWAVHDQYGCAYLPPGGGVCVCRAVPPGDKGDD